MANYQLPNDVVRRIPIVSKDAAGDVVPNPTGVTYTASADNTAALNVAIDGSTLVLNALQRNVAGINVTVDDDGPLNAFVLTVDIVDDVAPTSVGLDLNNTTDTPQAVPAA